MRHQSKTQAALYREFGPVREAYLEEMGRCAKCWLSFGDLACHEILAGCHRRNAFKARCCWLALCVRCHSELQSTDICFQLAYKLLSDPRGFDLPEFHKVWGRPETAITPAEVLESTRLLLMQRNTYE